MKDLHHNFVLKLKQCNITGELCIFMMYNQNVELSCMHTQEDIFTISLKLVFHVCDNRNGRLTLTSVPFFLFLDYFLGKGGVKKGDSPGFNLGSPAPQSTVHL